MEPTARSSGGKDERSAWALIGCFWFLLWLAGFPLPMGDDLFFIGAALNMGAGGGFTNPYCLSLQLYQNHFFLYVPFHSYALAAWIKVFGAGHGSLPGFQCLMSALASAGLWRLLRGTGVGLLLPLGICLTLAVYFSSIGLRPDVLGLALLAWGAVALRVTSGWAWFSGALLLFLSMITCPNFAVLAIYIAAAAFLFLRPGEPRSILLRQESWRIALCFGAWLVVALVFLWMIDFELRLFLSLLNNNRQAAEANSGLGAMVKLAGQNSRNAARLFAQILSPLVLYVATLGLAWRYRTRLASLPSGRFLGLLLAAGLLLYLPALTSATATRLPLMYAVLVSLYVACQWQGRGKRWLMGAWFAVWTFFVFAVGHLLIEWAALPLCPPARLAGEVRREVEARHPQHIYVDHFSARWVYDYHLPPNSFDFYHGRPETGRNLYLNFLPDSILVASRETVLFARPDLAARYPAPRGLAIVHALFPTMDANPYDCVVVPGDVSSTVPAP